MLTSFVAEEIKPVIKLLQITDSHLFKDEKSALLGVNTHASFAQVLAEINAESFDFDFVLATGDLVQDNSDEGYHRFFDMIKTLNKNVFWIPGNHDFQPKMFDILAHDPVLSVKHLLLGAHWQILLLDSQVFGVPHGRLSQYQLDWLQAKLKDNPNRYALVVLHHHLLPTNCAWLDQHNLRNGQDLYEILAPFPFVKGILYGHIHQQVDSEWHGYQIMATPSTCIQFKPDNNTFTLDSLQPGWREIELYPDGRILTRVKRIRYKKFLPDMQEGGY